MRWLCALLVATYAASAAAQGYAPEPEPCAGPGAENDPRCHEESVGGGSVNIDVPAAGGGRAAPAAAPLKPSGGGGGGGGGGLGGGDGRGLLVIAVIAAVALPVIVYALDDEAEPQERAKYDAFQVHAGASGGVLNIGGQTFGLAEFKGRVETSRFGIEGAFEATPLSPEWRAADLDLLLRFAPTKHLELAIALGGRWSNLAGEQRCDGEVAVPQRYVFWHSDGQSGGVELRPAVMVGANGADVRLDLGLVVPVGPVLSLQLGGRLFTHDFQQIGAEALGSFGAKF